MSEISWPAKIGDEYATYGRGSSARFENAVVVGIKLEKDCTEIVLRIPHPKASKKRR